MADLSPKQNSRWNRFLSKVDNYFLISERHSSFTTELRAGTVTFLTMSYILLVNPQILATAGMPKSDVVVATAVSAAFGSIFCGITSNLPFGLAPGLGLSAYLAYGLVNGTGMTWEEALTSCLIAGLINSAIAVFRVGDWIMRGIPECIKFATVVGMGLLLTLIGLNNIQLVVKDSENDALIKMGEVWTTEVVLSLIGVVVISTLQHHNVKGGILVGIASIALLSWAIDSSWPQSVVDIPSLSSSLLRIDFYTVSVRTIPSILAFMAVGIFDVSGVTFGVARIAGLIDKDGDIPGAAWALSAASFATVLASLLGCSPIIVHLESAAGAKEGAKTGLAAVVTGLWFCLSIFFAPIFGAVPSAATAPVLIFVGASMTELCAHIQWTVISEGVPSFLTMVLMPFTFSIPNGIFFGMAFKLVLSITTGEFWGYWLDWKEGRRSRVKGIDVGDEQDEEGALVQPFLDASIREDI